MFLNNLIYILNKPKPKPMPKPQPQPKPTPKPQPKPPSKPRPSREPNRPKMKPVPSPPPYIFGKEREGVHAVRLFNVAVVDLLLTLAGAYVICVYSGINFALVLIVLFSLGVVLHKAFCVETTLNKILFS
jgi:hypothetical protein